jgi:ligand-binding sensor domain-containing protein
VVQDKLGFMWFGTQYGLNRYDGYKSKVFKHEPGRAETLSCVFVRSLLVDRSGTLWVGCDRFLDRFDPASETFAHYRVCADPSDQLSTPIDRISEDHDGALWLATAKGLYKLDPASG